MFQTVFLSVIRSTKLHIQRQSCLTLYVQLCAPDDGRKNRLKHAEGLTEINKIEKRCICWLYSENILAMHGTMNVKKKCQILFELRQKDHANKSFYMPTGKYQKLSLLFQKILDPITFCMWAR